MPKKQWRKQQRVGRTVGNKNNVFAQLQLFALRTSCVSNKLPKPPKLPKKDGVFVGCKERAWSSSKDKGAHEDIQEEPNEGRLANC
jgi:hypothetical protein